eukprot:508576_1
MSRLEFINAYVDQANTSSDLISLLTHIPLSALQTFIKHHVQHSSDISINRMYHDALPMDTILPHDLIQNILSFDHLSIAHGAVSKTFKRLSDKNDLIQLKQRNRIILDPQYELNIDFQSGTRWIVYPNEPQLTGEERAINRREQRPFDLENALKQYQNDDILLLYDGEHIITSELLFGNNSLSLMGMGDNVIVKLKNDYSCVTYLQQGTMYFKNVHLKRDDSIRLQVTKNCHLWMEQCTLSDICITSSHSHEGSLHLKSCYFDGQGLPQDICIELLLDLLQTTIEIIGCTFTNCGDIVTLPGPKEEECGEEYPVIEIYNCYHSIDKMNIAQEGIKMVGNIFSNNKGRSVVFADDYEADSQERKENYNNFMQSNIVRIHHNIFRNKNGRVKKETSDLNETPNPNQIALGIHTYE